MARLLHADGTEESVAPANGNTWTLAELQALVGGFIEIAPWLFPLRVVWNEGGAARMLPVNQEATRIVLARLREDGRPLRYSPTIVGDVVVLDDKEAL